jgi:hypothetical protein
MAVSWDVWVVNHRGRCRGRRRVPKFVLEDAKFRERRRARLSRLGLSSSRMPAIAASLDHVADELVLRKPHGNGRRRPTSYLCFDF